MHLINCLNPREVVHHGHKHIVPCGVCEYCRFVRGLSMSERIRMEMDKHKYNIFVTLTYADPFLPTMRYMPGIDNDYFYIDDEYSSNSNEDGLMWKCKFKDRGFNKFLSLFPDGRIPRLSRADFQNFIKRFRRKVDYQVVRPLIESNKISKDEKEAFKIIYAGCGEYGPTCYRPHMHIVFMFDRHEIAEAFKRLLHSCWTYGSSTFKYASSTRHSQYVAQYINSVHKLPSALRQREVCPFLLVSKAEPIGFNQISQKEIQRVFRECSPTVSVYDPSKRKDIEYLLPNTLKNRLFPKFTGFDYIPHWLRTRLLRIAADTISVQDMIFEANRLKYRGSSLLSDYFNCCFKHDPSVLPSLVIDNCCKSLYYTAKRIEKNMALFNCFDWNVYVFKIEKFHENLDRLKLLDQFKFEDTYLSKHPDEFEYLDSEMMNYSKMKDFVDVRNVTEHIFSSIDNSHKNKRKNEYLALHPEYAVIRLYDEFLEGFVGSSGV